MIDYFVMTGSIWWEGWWTCRIDVSPFAVLQLHAQDILINIRFFKKKKSLGWRKISTTKAQLIFSTRQNMIAPYNGMPRLINLFGWNIISVGSKKAHTYLYAPMGPLYAVMWSSGGNVAIFPQNHRSKYGRKKTNIHDYTHQINSLYWEKSIWFIQLRHKRTTISFDNKNHHQ